MSTQRHFPLLRIFLPAESSWTELAWLAFDSAHHWAAQGEASIANLPSHDELELVLPAKRVSVHKLTLPAQAGKHLDALITQALEDRLLGDKADVLSLPGPQIGTERLIWVCSRKWLETELASLTAAGLSPEKIFPEYALLPDSSEATQYAQTLGGYLFRSPEGYYGLAGTPDLIASLSGGQAISLVPELYRLPCKEAGHLPFSGELSRFNRKTFDVRTLYRPTLMLALSGALLLVGSVAHWRQLENRETRLQHEIRQTFATTFPGTPIIDPVMQWESKRREQASPSRGDALDAVLNLAARLNAPIHPRQIEARDNFIRLTLTDTEVAQFKAPLESAGNPESSPAGTGLTRLQYSLSRERK
jgi:type II secretory pathway component PulL